MTSSASPTYRGYRLQLLYALHRILPKDSAQLFFQPEGYEDLDVYNEFGELIEVIQVKAFQNTKLAFSNFEPTNKNKFFGRIANLIKQHPFLEVKIISFGEIGEELEQGLNENVAKQNILSAKP